MKKEDLNHSKLIQKINLLGPWVHGYFELYPNLTIKDSDLYQQQRLFQLKKQLIDIIENHYGRVSLKDKTLCDIGCNAGYFLFELFKHFGFKKAVGYDPKITNISKARFIAKQFSLPKDRFKCMVGNIFSLKRKSFDVVIMPGVLHHLDDHMLAAKRLFQLTNELLILECMALPDEVESNSMKQFLELKDDVYKSNKPIFGVTGLKFESHFLDGAAATSGVVSIPSKNAIYLELFNAGFSDIKLYDVSNNSNAPESGQYKYRNFCNVLAVAKKPKGSQTNFFESNTEIAHKSEIDVWIPRHIIEPLYLVIKGQTTADNLGGEARAIWSTLMQQSTAVAIDEIENLKKKPYYNIVSAFSHQPIDKISFEYGKSLFFDGDYTSAEKVLTEVVSTLNCDWRSVYRSYHVLTLIAEKQGHFKKAREFNRKTLIAYTHFFPAIQYKRVNASNS